MPFNPSKPPVGKINGLSKLSDKKQRQWVHVFNSSLSGGDSEETAIKKAWGATKSSKEAQMKTAEKLKAGFEKIAREDVYESTVGLSPAQLRQQMANLRANRKADSWTSTAKGFLGMEPETVSTINNTNRVINGRRPDYVIGTSNDPTATANSDDYVSDYSAKGVGIRPTPIKPGYFSNIFRNNFVQPMLQGNVRSQHGLSWF
jgi:hypothetical protein